jgi:WD40 repeat protein
LPTITARFATALDIENEPDLLARLVDLASVVRREDAPASGLPPYKGLWHYDEADADMFFGREALIARLLARVVAPTTDALRFLAIVGASGSGKSSLLRAGLVPSLRWSQASASWSLHSLTPTAYPLQALAHCLGSAAQLPSTSTTLADEFVRDPRSLTVCLAQLPAEGARAQPMRRAGLSNADAARTATRQVLVVDQFEELFTLCRAEHERRAFIDNLMAAATEPEGAAYVLVALRADFYDQCAPYGALREAIAAHQEYIGAMNPAELRRAIKEPARRGGWEFEPGLADTILEAVAGEPGVLPLLSHALHETWQRRHGRLLTLSGYMSSGGVRGAIAETAEAVYHDQLDGRQQAIARRIFLRLTAVGESEAVADTRRRASFAELISKPDEQEAVRTVLTLLADARLVTTGDNEVEIAHEALIREWPTLRGWLEEDRAGLRLHRHLAESAEDWLSRQRDPADLYRGARLAQAVEWADMSPQAALMNSLEREFLRASQAGAESASAEREAQRQRELVAARQLAAAQQQRAEEQALAASRLRARNRAITAIGALGLILAVLAGALAVQSNRNAAQAGANLALAQANLARAESLRLAAQSNTLMSENGDPETAVLLSLRALGQAYTPAADGALVSALGRLPNQQQFVGHTGWVYAAAFSPDSQYVLTGSLDQTARLWEAATGRVIRTFSGHAGGVVAVAFSPDGRYVLTGSSDRTARLWDAATGQQLRSFVGHTAGLTRVAFSPDGSYVLTGSGDNTARLWEAATGQPVRTFAGHASLVTAVAFSPDGHYVLTGSLDKTARLWEVATGQEVRAFTGHAQGVNAVAFAPDGASVLTGSSDDTAQLWDAGTGQAVRTFAGHDSYVEAVAFSPDGRYVLTGSADKTARLWEAATGRQLRALVGHGGGIRSVAFSADGRDALTASDDSTARLWDLGTGPARRVFAGQSGGVVGAAFSPDGQQVLTAQGKLAVLWNSATGLVVRTFAGHTQDITSIAYSPDGRYVLTGGDDRTLRLWDAHSGQALRTYTGMSVGPSTVAFSPDSQWMAATGQGEWAQFGTGYTHVWNVGTGQLVAALNLDPGLDLGGVESLMAFSSDGQTLLMRATSSTGVMLVDTKSWSVRSEFGQHLGLVRGVAFSPDGLTVLTGSDDKTAKLWDARTGQLLRQFSDQASEVLSVAFSPDGHFVLTGQADGSARLWDAATGEEIRELLGHQGEVTSAAFSRDGRYIVTGSQDGTARQWDTDYHDTIRLACSLLWRDLTLEEAAQFSLSLTSPTCPP